MTLIPDPSYQRSPRRKEYPPLSDNPAAKFAALVGLFVSCRRNYVKRKPNVVPQKFWDVFIPFNAKSLATVESPTKSESRAAYKSLYACGFFIPPGTRFLPVP